MVIKPSPALLHSETAGTLEAPGLGVPQLPEELAGVVDVVLSQGNTGHDPVYPAPAPGSIAVHGGDLVATADPPGHGADLDVFVVFSEADVRGAAVSFTGVAVLLSAHTEPGRMETEVFPAESFVCSELFFTILSRHYRHLHLLQGVTEEAKAV